MTTATMEKVFLANIRTTLFPMGPEWGQISAKFRCSQLRRMENECREEIDKKHEHWNNVLIFATDFVVVRQRIFDAFLRADMQKYVPQGATYAPQGGETWIPIGPFHFIEDEGLYVVGGGQPQPMLRTSRVFDPAQNQDFQLTAAVWTTIECRAGLKL